MARRALSANELTASRIRTVAASSNSGCFCGYCALAYAQRETASSVARRSEWTVIGFTVTPNVEVKPQRVYALSGLDGQLNFDSLPCEECR